MSKQLVTGPKLSRRWFTIGPGIILAVIIAIQVIISQRKTDVTPPVIERYVSGAVAPDSVVPIDGINTILRMKDKLGLTSKQVSSIMTLKSEWDKKSGPLGERLHQAVQDFDSFMAGQSERKASIKEVQSHAVLTSGISGQIAGLRVVYWQKTLMILDARQKKVLKDSINTGARNGTHTYDTKGGGR